MAIGAPCSGDGILTGDTDGTCCAGSAIATVSGALGFSDAPGGAVSFEGDVSSGVSVD